MPRDRVLKTQTPGFKIVVRLYDYGVPTEIECEISERKMPCLNLTTSVNLAGVNTSAILSEVTSSVAKVMGVPESWIMVSIRGSVPMAIAGKEESVVFGDLVAVGDLSPSVNKKLSAALASIFESKLNVPKSHVYLKFFDSPGSDFGWNGSTL